MENNAKQIDEKNKLMAGVFTAQHIIIAKLLISVLLAR